MKLSEQEQLKKVFGENIPKDIKRVEYEDGTVVYSTGKLNVKRLINSALALMS